MLCWFNRVLFLYKYTALQEIWSKCYIFVFCIIINYIFDRFLYHIIQMVSISFPPFSLWVGDKWTVHYSIISTCCCCKTLVQDKGVILEYSFKLYKPKGKRRNRHHTGYRFIVVFNMLLFRGAKPFSSGSSLSTIDCVKSRPSSEDH